MTFVSAVCFGLYCNHLVEIRDSNSFSGFPWKALPEGTVICDVGGGKGHVSMHIAKNYGQINVVLQDLPHVLVDARPFWDETAHDIVRHGRVKFIPLDFLKEDAAGECDVYYVR